MTVQNHTRALLREWKAGRTVRDCANKRRETPDGSEGAKANVTFKESAGAIVQAVIVQQNDSFAIADLTALLDLVICVMDEEVTENAAAAVPLLRKAWRVSKALRDAKAQEPDPETPPEQKPYGEIFNTLESRIGALATLSRLIASYGSQCTGGPSLYQGEQREREEQRLSDVLCGLSLIRNQAEALEGFLADHRTE